MSEVEKRRAELFASVLPRGLEHAFRTLRLNIRCLESAIDNVVADFSRLSESPSETRRGTHDAKSRN